METTLFFLVMISTSFAANEDLSGKVFVFPKETNQDHVKLQTSQTQFHNITVCLRFLTDLKRNYGLFSLSTPTNNNAFVIFGRASEDILSVNVKDSYTFFLSLSFQRNIWHSVCATWQSDNGVAQLWLDGKPTIKRFITTGPISGKPITVLGQEQDTYGGSFDVSKSFLGMISQVHMWDCVLPPAEVKRYMNGKHFAPGNVFNWRSLEYEITGQVFVDDDPENV